MKVVFLDFDGVLNRTEAAQEGVIEPLIVGVLNGLLEQTGAKVVVSSSWRCHRSAEETLAVLTGAGFSGDVVGYTPDLGVHAWQTFVPERGKEILTWLRGEGKRLGVTSFVILDDLDDMGCLFGRLVQTRLEDGLTEQKAAEAARLLESPAQIP